MGDLISRSELIEAMTEVYKKHYAGDVSASGFTIAMEMVRKQPTAYNVENVVAEIRRCSGNGYRDVDGDYVPPMIRTKDVIDIVEAGGVDD